MNQKEITQEVVSYLKSDQWQELMRQLTQTEEELYHTHIFVENKIAMESIKKLFEKYFKQRGMPLDRKIDAVSPALDIIGAHSIHPRDPERAMYIPAFDFFWKYNPNVVLKPADPSKLSEEGKTLLTWGKTYMDNFLKKFEFKCVGPKEEREIRKWFESAQWKKGLRWVEDPRYTHVHINVEINFHPWILKMFAIEALKTIGWKLDHVVPCVFHIPRGYQGKIVFLTGYPEEVWDIAWEYNPDVVIRPASKRFMGAIPEDGDIAFDVLTKAYADELMTKYEYEGLTDEQIDEILEQV